MYIAPSGVQKERLTAADLFLLNLHTGAVTKRPENPLLKMSQCTPLFWNCYELRPRTHACIHTHSINAVLATLIAGDRAHIELTHLEMIKGYYYYYFIFFLDWAIPKRLPCEPTVH